MKPSALAKPLAFAKEEDIVTVFRQAIKEEMRRAQNGYIGNRKDALAAGATPGEALRYLAKRQDELDHEVALLRTIVLRLVSEPVDGNDDDNGKVPTLKYRHL